MWRGGTTLSAAKGVVPLFTTPFAAQGVPESRRSGTPYLTILLSRHAAKALSGTGYLTYGIMGD